MNANDSDHHGDHTRQEKMRAFLKAHDIRLDDVGEQLAKVMPERIFSRNKVYYMLYINKVMPRVCREHLINLGFPEDTLPPPKSMPQFPGLAGRETGQNRAESPAA